MFLEKKDCALQIKLFYQNCGNLSTALTEYRRLNCFRKGLTLRQASKKIIQKIEETGDLGVRRGRGRKRISNKAVEVTFAILSKENPVPNILHQAFERYHVICLALDLQCETF